MAAVKEPPNGPKGRLLSRGSWRVAAAVWVVTFLFINITTGNLHGAATIREFRLATEGRTTLGTVTALQPSNHAGCEFTYQVAGKTYSRAEGACGGSPRVGSAVSVTYLPSHADIATTHDAVSVFWENVVLILGAPSILSVIIFLGLDRRSRTVGTGP